MWNFNESLFVSLYGLAHHAPLFDVFIVVVASIVPFVLVVLAVIHAFRLHSIRSEFSELFWLLLPSISALLLSLLIKSILLFPRPFAYSYDVAPLITVSDPFGSFPSSHAMVFAAFGLAVYLHDHRFGRRFLIAAALVSVARVIAGVHWPFDIFVGYFLGLLVALCVYQIESHIKKDFKEL